ncbi:hypothetical protein WJ33_03115 [Burkholderia ubonensis]|uniref:Uncharacterized protein n=1 Tax=Burkholderia ubonensis TaxID=101571 RepID=A0A118HTI6_9BURK|nr:hypothetical protein WJ33_03115 [Burkholderia ubonensis]
MRRLGVRRTQFAIGIDAARQQIVKQPLLECLELGDNRLGFTDGGVEGVEDLGNLRLLVERWTKDLQLAQMLPRRSRHLRADSRFFGRSANMLGSKHFSGKTRIDALIRSQDQYVSGAVAIERRDDALAQVWAQLAEENVACPKNGVGTN